jgi:phosphoribosyl-AMP cyclohydrolase
VFVSGTFFKGDECCMPLAQENNYEPLLACWAEQLRRDEPHAVAVLCHGSYARGAPEPHSDLDLDVLVEGQVADEYQSAFEVLPDGRLLHVTIATWTLVDWLDQFAEPALSEDWAFFLPVRQEARLLWANDAARERLAGRITLELAGSPQLQDLLESAAKVRNGWARRDDLGVRLGAQDMALRCPAVLGLINPPHPVETRRAALQAALDLPAAPAGYRDDMLICLGLSGRAATMQDVHDAALRLAVAILTLLQGHPEAVAGQVEPGLSEALADGRLLRLVLQPDTADAGS